MFHPWSWCFCVGVSGEVLLLVFNDVRIGWGGQLFLLLYFPGDQVWLVPILYTTVQASFAVYLFGCSPSMYSTPMPLTIMLISEFVFGKSMKVVHLTDHYYKSVHFCCRAVIPPLLCVLCVFFLRNIYHDVSVCFFQKIVVDFSIFREWCALVGNSFNNYIVNWC